MLLSSKIGSKSLEFHQHCTINVRGSHRFWRSGEKITPLFNSVNILGKQTWQNTKYIWTCQRRYQFVTNGLSGIWHLLDVLFKRVCTATFGKKRNFKRGNFCDKTGIPWTCLDTVTYNLIHYWTLIYPNTLPTLIEFSYKLLRNLILKSERNTLIQVAW